jgi:biopolymer transport protein ExbD
MISAGDGGGQDFELNLASIIDCLTVIIAFLLMSSSFVSFGAMDTAVAAPQSGAAASPSSEDSKSVTLTLRLVGEKGDEQVEWEVTSGNEGKPREKKTLPRAGLLAELQGAKTRYPGLQGVVLSAAPRVQYQQVIQTMDETRKVFSAVILGVSGGGT